MRIADRGDATRVARNGQPIADGGADSSAFDGWLAAALMPGDQQENAVSSHDGALDRPVDGSPCAVQVVPMEIEHPVGFDRSRPQAPLPMAVEVRARPNRWR